MSDDLEITGERLIEAHYRTSMGGYIIYLMHAASYRFAEKYCHGMRVLDLGCGSGYGAETIAEHAEEVYAVDVSAEAIEFARNNYIRSNLHFELIHPGDQLPFPDHSFDVVLSFQVIEHVEDDAKYLAEAERVLKDEGIFIVITPDRQHRLFPGQWPWNRWHLREYTEKQLTQRVAESFQIKLSLQMGALPDIAAVEIQRYRKLKWLTLPFTFPGVPKEWRRVGLDLIHHIKPQKLRVSTPFEPKFGVEAILIGAKVEKSLNLIVVAKPHRRP